MSNIKRSSGIFLVQKYKIPISSEWKPEQTAQTVLPRVLWTSSSFHRRTGVRDFESARRTEIAADLYRNLATWLTQFLGSRPRDGRPLPRLRWTRDGSPLSLSLSFSSSWWRVHLPSKSSATKLTVRSAAHTNCYRIISSTLALGSGQRKLLRRDIGKETRAIEDSSSASIV